jgi:hypothetical protein
MQTHRMAFNERFTQYLNQKNQDPGLIEATASAYLHRRIKELVGDNSELRRALRYVEVVFTTLSRHSISEMVSAARVLHQLNNRILPKNRTTQLTQLHERLRTTLQLIDRVKKMYLMQSRSTKNPLLQILLRLLSAFKKPPQREYQQLQNDVSIVDLSIIMPEHVEAFPDYAPLVIDKLCTQVDQLRNQIVKIERWQRRREHLCQAIDSQKKDVELIAKLHDTLNRHVALIAQLFETHRSANLHSIFKLGLGKENAVEDTIKHPVYQLGLQIHQSLCETGPANPGKLLSLRQQLECVVDITVRYEAFHMAMRYWESRWIEEASTPLAEDPQLEVRMALERAAMLAPVIVATTQTLPALALYLDQNGMPQHRMEIADWLVMDESGQVPPQLSIPLTALARKALAVGDVQQLEPVVTVDQRSNQDLRRRHGLGDTSSQHQRNSLDAVHGNFMACAQYAASRHDNAARGNYGVMLKYHYRCRKTIIEFCNRLVYYAIEPLVPMIPDVAHFARTPNEATQQEALLPPMGFVAIEGQQFAVEASQSNQEEVNAIIGWLKENRTAIKQRYGSVEKAVSVIAPYGAQVNKLKEALSASGFKVRQHDSDELVDEALIDQDNTDEMVVGTVHSLQGAEKEIVLFSTVNDPTGKIFIDRKASMLNVAVSRAKHAFIVFGHPGVILKPSGSYSGILAAYLLQFGYRLYPRDLYILESQTKTQLVEQAFGKIAQGIATGGHLREFDVSDNGALRWRNKSNAQSFLAQLQQFIHLGQKHYDHIYLATDDDREGEAIAWHVMELAKQLSNDIPNERYRRLRFYAMTPAALVEGKKFVTRGIDPMRVKAAIARAMADKFIAIEIQELAHVTAGRVSAGLLDEIERIQQQNTAASYIDTVVVFTGRKEAIKLTRLAENDPLGDPALFANPDDSPINKQIEGDLILAEVMIERVGPLLRTEDAAPATSTAQVLHRAIHDLNLSPMEVMDALQEIYSGSSILEESEEEDI